MSSDGYQAWLTNPDAQTPEMQAERERVSINRATFEELTRQADAYRDLSRTVGTVDNLVQMLIDAPGVRDLLMSEYVQWSGRKERGESASAVSAANNGHQPGPSQEQLATRRRELGAAAAEFYARHGREYTGGPVDWATGKPATKPVTRGHDLAA